MADEGVDYLLADQARARTTALESLDPEENDPREAATADRLSRVTGADPALIYSDVPGYQERLKSHMVDEFLRTNPALQDYANSHPLAAKVSANDWANLDAVDESLSKIARSSGSVAGAAVKAFREHWNWDDALGTGISEANKNNRLLWSISTALTQPAYAIYAGIPMSVFTSGLAAVQGGVAEGLVQSGMSEGQAQYHARQLTSLVEARSMRLEGAAHDFTRRLNEGLRRDVQRALPFIQAGATPPDALGGLVAEARKLEDKEAAKHIDELMKTAGKSETKAEAPDLFKENFVRPKVEGIHVGLDRKALDILYPEGKRPEPGDNLLGDMPGIDEQFERAQATGADVDIPLDWFAAKLPKEVYQEIKDHIRPTTGGKTPEEHKRPVAVEEPKPPPTAEEPVAGLPTAPEEGFPKPEPAEEVPPTVAEAVTPEAGRPPTPDMAKAMRAGAEAVAAKPGTVPAFELGAPPLIDTMKDVAGLGPEGWDKIQTEPETPPPERGIVPEKTAPGDIVGVESKATFPISAGLAEVDQAGLSATGKLLTDFFKDRITRLVGDVPIILVDAEGMKKLAEARGNPSLATSSGIYLYPDHQIAMLEDVARGAQGHDRAAHVLIHEGSHALTIRAMNEHPEIKELAQSLMDEADKALTRAAPSDRSLHSYAFKDVYEFVAEAFSNPRFRDLLSVVPLSKELAERLGVAKEQGTSVWMALKRVIKDALERVLGVKVPPTVLDGVLRLGETIEKEEVARQISAETSRRMADDMMALGAPPEGPVPDYLQQAFKTGSALKMNNQRLRAYLEAVAKEHEERVEFTRNQAIVDEGRRATKEWKKNLPIVRGEAREDLQKRPDVAVDRYLREGVLPNGAREQKVKLLREAIPEEFRERIPKEYIDARRGEHPDAVAGRFGYQSGREALEHLARLEEQRKLEGLTPPAHLAQLVEAETQRRMEKDYGRSAEDILEAAKKNTFTPATHDILHHRLAALYEEMGQTPLTKEQIEAYARAVYDKIEHPLHRSDKYIAEMFRQNQEIIDHLLAGKPEEALKVQQDMALLAHHAEWATETEALRAKLDGKLKSWTKREIPGIAQEGGIWIHDILGKLGVPVMRIEGDLERHKALLNEQRKMVGGVQLNSLRDFVNWVNQSKLQNPDNMQPGKFPVAYWLQGDNVGPNTFPLNELTHQELEDAWASLIAIDKWARNLSTVEVKGEQVDLKDVVSGLTERLKAAVNYKPIAPGDRQNRNLVKKAGRVFGSLFLNPESWAFRLDLGNAHGPFNQLIIRPIMEGLYEERDMQREFAKLWEALPNIGRREKIPNPNLFMDPGDNFKTPMKLDTHNLRAIIQNMGNPLQAKKLAEGYGIKDPNQIWDWLFNTVGITKKDFDWAHQLADIFNKAYEETERRDIDRFGIAPQRIELGEIQTPWGVEKGFYHPLIPDSTRHSERLTPDEMMDQSGFYRPAPASGFTQERTEVRYPIDLTLDLVPHRLKQILKYNAMAKPVQEVGKIIGDGTFQKAFSHYYGKEYNDALKKWLEDVAGRRDWDPAGWMGMARMMGYLQENMATAAIAFNMGTVAKHAPTAFFYSLREGGTVDFGKSMLKLLTELPGSQETWKNSFGESAEIRSRWRSVRETIEGTSAEVFRAQDWKKGFLDWREAVKSWGHAPVAFTDLISAVGLWDAVYSRLMEKGMSRDDAVYEANTAVRRTHGSTIIGARAGITRIPDPTGLLRASSTFYNFMSNALQRNYEMMWRAKLAMQGRELPAMTGFEKESYEKGLKHLPKIAGGLFTFGILTGLIEQAVSPLPKDRDEGDIGYWAKAVLLRPYAGMVLGLRDVFNYAFEGRDPSSGMYSTLIRDVGDVMKENTWLGDNPEVTFRRAHNALAAATGLTNEAWRKVGTYLYKATVSGEEDLPTGPVEAWEAMRHGTLLNQPRNFEELIEEMQGQPKRRARK